MKHTLLVIAFAAALGSSASAQNTPSTNGSGSAMKLTQNECSSVWQQAGGSSGKGLTEAQAKPYVSDFKSANPDGDLTIDQNEFMNACSKGLVKSSASTGASSGTAGNSEAAPPKTPNAGGAAN